MRVKVGGPESGRKSGKPAPGAPYPFFIDGGKGCPYTDFLTLLHMKFYRLLPAFALVAGCAAPPEQDIDRPSDIVKDPSRIHEFFLKKIREREDKVAAQVTTLDPDAFYFGVRNEIAPDLTRRILLGFEQHEVRVNEDRQGGIARWCNKEFGLSYDFPLRSEIRGKIWRLHITREQIEELARAGLAWFRKQREAADGRVYAYPPDWIATPVSTSCPCGK